MGLLVFLAFGSGIALGYIVGSILERDHAKDMLDRFTYGRDYDYIRQQRSRLKKRPTGVSIPANMVRDPAKPTNAGPDSKLAADIAEKERLQAKGLPTDLMEKIRVQREAMLRAGRMDLLS